MKRVIVWTIVIVAAILLMLHWGFLGCIVVTIVYGLWAENTDTKTKKHGEDK